MIKLIFLQMITLTIVCGSNLTIIESFSKLFNFGQKIHATPHITNIIRNGPGQLSNEQHQKLEQLGLIVQHDKFIVERPEGLNRTYSTDHFLLHYTLDDSYDAVENENYVIMMAEEFEYVWNFFIDSLGFDHPPGDNGLGGSDLYDIYIINLPSGYFGLTYTSNASASDPSCASFIKMRNSYSASVFSSHSELENIQVTAVHEFFHAIQFGYNCFERLWFMEATAVWSEDELYNNINDLYRYMPSWFANTNKPLDEEDSHMYGSFIFFQYLDEHLGGRSTIKHCWERSRYNASPSKDVSFLSINETLNSQNSSFIDAYIRMRIANRILSSSLGAGIYRYEEADTYPIEKPSIKEEIIYTQNNIETRSNTGLKLYSSHYYDVVSSTPISINIFNNSGTIKDLSFTAVTKHKNKDQWIIRTDDKINIDPSIGIEYTSVIISAVNNLVYDLNYSLKLSDGYMEDFTLFVPYPNPVLSTDYIHFDLRVVTPQSIQIKILNVLGKTIWYLEKDFQKPEIKTIRWNFKSTTGKKIANGVYLIQAIGQSNSFMQKMTYLRKSD